MALVKPDEDEQIIKPESVTPTVDTSDWPLLLKNWDKCKSMTVMVERHVRALSAAPYWHCTHAALVHPETDSRQYSFALATSHRSLRAVLRSSVT